MRRDDRLPVDELVLLDIDRERLDVVGALADRMMRKVGWTGRLSLTTDRLEAIEGADFVIVQLRVGGNQARYLDETIPLEFGCIGQETTGPGGFAKALRTVPVVLELAQLTAERGAPEAWFVDFTNPTGLVSQALLDEGHRAIGLCNVAIGFQRDFAEIFGVDPGHVGLDHVGLNHLTWERKVLVDGVDRLPELLDPAVDPSACGSRVPGRARRGDPAGDRPDVGRHPLVLPAVLLPDRPRDARAARWAQPGQGGHGDRGRAARALQGSHPRHEAGTARGAGRRLLQRRCCGIGGVAACGHRRHAGREPAERRCDPEPARRRRRGDRGSHRRLRRTCHRHRPARTRDGRAGPAREGLRAPHDRCCQLGQPSHRPEGDCWRTPSSGTTNEPGPCSMRCLRRTSATCPGSSRPDALDQSFGSSPAWRCTFARASTASCTPRSPSRNTASMR